MKIHNFWPIIALLISMPAQANVNEIFAELFGRPDRGGVKASYGLQQYESAGVKQTQDKLSLRQHRMDASIPLNNLSDKKWKLLLNANGDEIRSAARFPNGRPLPNKLWQIGAGLSHMRMLEGDRTIGGSFLIGSSGDKPFSAARDLTYQGNMVYKVPLEGEAAWVFFLNVSNTRGFLNNIPLPGAAYFFKAHSRLRMAVGLPFFTLFWTPIDKTIFSLSYFPLYNAQAKFSYFIFGPAHVFIQAKYQSDNYFLSDRANKKEKIFYEEAFASVGFAMPLERNILVDGTAGYSFDRKYFLGEKSSARKDGQLRRPDKATFASIKLIASF